MSNVTLDTQLSCLETYLSRQQTAPNTTAKRKSTKNNKKLLLDKQTDPVKKNRHTRTNKNQNLIQNPKINRPSSL